MEFVAKVAEQSGAVSEKIYTSESAASLKGQLESQGLCVYRVRARRTALRLFTGDTWRVGDVQFLNFNQEFVALIHAGLPIVQCLSLLAERRADSRFKEVLSDLRDRVKAGTSLSDAFSEQGAAFPAIYAPTLTAGEKSGDLEGVLRRFVRYSQVMTEVKRKFSAAIVYPVVLVVLSCVLVGILMTYVIPRFAGFYGDFDAKLPTITRWLITASTFAQSNILLILAVVVAAVLLFRYASRVPGMHRLRDRLILDAPLAGDVLRRYSVSQFSRTLGTLLGGGLPLVPSLGVAASSVTNELVKSRMERVAVSVREGGPLTEALQETGLLDPTVLQMIAVGENAGALTEMLENVSDFYDGEVDRKVQRFVTLLEPALLVIMGGVVAGMLLAMYYPLFNLIQVVR